MNLASVILKEIKIYMNILSLLPTQDKLSDAYTLKEFLGVIQELIGEKLSHSYWIIAEIARVNKKNGHLYIDLVERSKGKEGILARCQSIIWKARAFKIQRNFEEETGVKLEAGIEILALVNASFHVVYGFTLIIEAINPGYNIGQMAKKKKEILEKLEKEALIELNKSLEFPVAPLRVALISSSSAAGFFDFLAHLKCSKVQFPINVVLYESIMQGKQTCGSILRSFKAMIKDNMINPFDTVAIVRGGGAASDLHWFDDLELAKAVAYCPIPVICGIGHEIDKGVLDYVAHTSVKTPTDAANIILSTLQDCLASLNSSQALLMHQAKDFIRKQRSYQEMLFYRLKHETLRHSRKFDKLITNFGLMLQNKVNRYFYSSKDRLLWMAYKILPVLPGKIQTKISHQLNILSVNTQRLSMISKMFTNKHKHHILGLLTHTKALVSHKLTLSRFKISKLKDKIELSNPDILLARGFTLTLDPDFRVPMKSWHQAIKKKHIITHFKDGEVLSMVKDGFE